MLTRKSEKVRVVAGRVEMTVPMDWEWAYLTATTEDDIRSNPQNNLWWHIVTHFMKRSIELWPHKKGVLSNKEKASDVLKIALNHYELVVVKGKTYQKLKSTKLPKRELSDLIEKAYALFLEIGIGLPPVMEE